MDGIFRVRHNAAEVSSLQRFAEIRGSINGGCKDVYFIRMVGMSPGYADEVERMDRILSERMLQGQCRYSRADSLPGRISAEEVSYYSGCYENWQRSGRKKAGTRATNGNAQLEEALGSACVQVAELFGRLTPHANASILKNFMVKLLYWMDQGSAGQELLADWRPEGCCKYVLSNVSKKQEYLFGYVLTLLGVDVLLLQYQSDISGQMESMQLSKKVVLGAFGDCPLPSFDLSRYRLSVSAPAAPKEERRVVVNVSQARPHRERKPLNVSTGGSPKGASERREMDFEALAQLASSVVMISVHDRSGEILGTGSGIMIGPAGYILTNNHVISGGSFYSVRIEDDEGIYKTDEVIKYNSVLDLAVIRIDRRLRPIPIYRGSRKLVRGQKVVAIGSPLGLFNSVSDGIISGFRVVNNVDMIQFTAPTSHGSSGGAVLNMYGEVIGISTAGFDGGQNINLAVGYECVAQFVRGFT